MAAGDKISLPETREKRQDETAGEPAKIIPDENQHAAIF
jgi:hypothetical protein